MIVVINSLGGLVSLQDEDLHQGSTKLNKIDLVAPFADNVVFKANFEMPDGTIKPDNLDGYLFTPSMKIVDDLNVWKLPITFPITQDYGIVTMQLRGYIGDTIVCSTSIKLPIQKGVPYASNFEELSDKDQLLQMISDLKALINGKVDNINYTIEEAAYVNRYTEGQYFVYNDETEQYVSKVLPQDYKDGISYYKITSIGKVVNTDNGLFLEFVDNLTNQSIKLKIEKDKATLNDKQIVVFDDLKASNVKYDNINSEMKAGDTQEALDEIVAKIKELEFSQYIDLGDIEIPSYDWNLVDGFYHYRFTHEKFTNASIQSLMVTPDDNTINLLNLNDVMLYPEIEIIQHDEDIAVAIIKADKKPTFSIFANFKIISIKPDTNVNEIKASSVTFVPNEKINKHNVQSAINQVQENVDKFENTYNNEKQNFASLDENGKIKSDQISSLVQDVFVGSYYEGEFYTDNTHTQPIKKATERIYIDINSNKLYFWNLRWVELNSYDEDINKIINGETKVGNTTKINNIEISKDENGILKVGDIIIPQKKTLWENKDGLIVDETHGGTGLNANIEDTINVGDIIEIISKGTNNIRVDRFVVGNKTTEEYTNLIEIKEPERVYDVDDKPYNTYKSWMPVLWHIAGQSNYIQLNYGKCFEDQSNSLLLFPVTYYKISKIIE